MNKSKAIKIAIAFKRGAAFIRGMRQLAQDADIPEGARWITIGAHAVRQNRAGFRSEYNG